jgi:hypothetical protein
MTAITCEMQQRFCGSAAGFRAASANGAKTQFTHRADCVEKLVIFDPLMLVITLISFGCS